MRTSADSLTGRDRLVRPFILAAVSVWLQPEECPQPTGLPNGKLMPRIISSLSA